jgi:IPT/TIG domain
MAATIQQLQKYLISLRKETEMDPDLSYAAVVRFESLESRVSVLEAAGGITPPPSGGVTVVDITPTEGTDGTMITITGTGFAFDLTVAMTDPNIWEFLTSVERLSDQQATAVIPASTFTDGVYSVEVSSGGTTATLSDCFTYTAPSQEAARETQEEGEETE